MSGQIKSRLKASREAIQARDWDAALQAADQVLEEDANNYNAHVFKGLALLHTASHTESEQSYRQAIHLQPQQWLAWQGLEKLYTDTHHWEQLCDTLEKEMHVALELEDATKCAEFLQRLVSVQREHGSKSNKVTTLEKYLPASPFYGLLSDLPAPDLTNPEKTTTFDAQLAIHVESLKVIQEIITLTEEIEKSNVDNEIAKRRTRLDSARKSREQIRNEVGLEVWGASRLPDLYEQVLAHPNASDEARREAEHNLLLFRMQYLKALPNPKADMAGPTGAAAELSDVKKKEAAESLKKARALDLVRELVEGIVAIDVADELAWRSVLEWQDPFYLVDLNYQRLRAFIYHFPRAGLSSSLRAFLTTVNDEQYLAEQKEVEKNLDKHSPPKDSLTLALDGLDQDSQSVLAHRIAATYFMIDGDWFTCSDIAKAGLTLARQWESQLDVNLVATKASLEEILATALTHLHPPQHHPRALRLFDAALNNTPTDLAALFGKAQICQSSSQWEQARAILVDIVRIENETDKDRRYIQLRSFSTLQHPEREAKMEIAWCDIHLGSLENAERELREIVNGMSQDRNVSSLDEAKAWWRLGRCLWDMGDFYRSDRSQAFSCFVTSLKKDATYAPGFTSLGFYYKDAAEPADHQRSAKCFQKAFELDATQDEAASELAKIYAKDDDWDLVELVARRTIEAEGGDWVFGQHAGQARHTTRNAWAWNAIGSTELIRGHCEKAIIAFQVALRNFPYRHHLWMRLGEAYLASERHSAAIKAFERARELQPNSEKWQAMFCIANVQREIGMLDEAVQAYEAISVLRPNLPSIQIVCAETRLILAQKHIQEGYGLRAANEIRKSLVEAHTLLTGSLSMSAAWKVVADGLFTLSTIWGLNIPSIIMDQCVAPLLKVAETHRVDENLPTVSAIDLTQARQSMLETTPQSLVFPAAFIYKLRVVLFGKDEEVAGSVWADLGIALATVCETLSSKNSDTERINECKCQAIACVKEALKLEPGNGFFWNMLGNLVFDNGVPLAQHCYIKSIECDSKNSVSWTSLGFLYLAYDDVALAHESFLRAQTLDPDSASVWVGHALTASHRGEKDLSRAMFQNAYSLSAGDVIEAAYGFAASVLDSSASDGTKHVSKAQLQSSAFAMTAFLARRPSDCAGLHLSALLAEQLGETAVALDRINLASSILEAQYEQHESVEKAQLFAVCMVNLGRIHLNNGDYEQAKSVFEMGLGLLSDDQEAVQVENTLPPDFLERLRLGAHCGIGLAHSAQSDWEEAKSALSLALQESDYAPASTSRSQLSATKEILSVILAQVQYASGDAKTAESTLMEHLSDNPQSIRALITLGALSAVGGDNEQLHVIVSDLRNAMEQYQETNMSRKNDRLIWDATYFLMLVYIHLGQLHECIDCLLANKSTEAHTQLIDLYLRLSVSGPDASQDAEYAELAHQSAKQLYHTLRMRPQEAWHGLAQAPRYSSVATALVDHHTNVPHRMATCALRLAPENPKHWQLWDATHALRKTNMGAISRYD